MPERNEVNDFSETQSFATDWSTKLEVRSDGD
jgi:hypothetical protein